MTEFSSIIKASLLTLALNGLVNIGNAQVHSYNVNWGPEIVSEVNQRYLNHDESYFYQYNPTSNEIQVRKFNFDNELESEKKTSEVSNVVYQRGARIDLNGTGYLFSSTKNNNGKSIDFFLARIDGGSVEPPKLIYSVLNDEKWRQEPIIVSKDGSHFALILVSDVKHLFFQNKSELQKYHLVVFDSELNDVWSRDYLLDASYYWMTISNTTITNRGEIFLSTKVWKNKDQMKVGFPNYQTVINLITVDDVKSIDVVTNDNVILSTMRIWESEHDGLIFSGFYGDRVKKSGDIGIFFGKIDLVNNSTEHKIYPFTHSFLLKLKDEGYHNYDTHLQSGGFLIRKFIELEEGGFTFIAEYYRVNVGDKTTYTTTDLIIPRFDPNGELLQLEMLDKKFIGIYDDMVSFGSAYFDNKIYLVYNTRKEKKERIEIDKIHSGPGSIYTDIAVIGNEGKIISTETLFIKDKIGGYFSTYWALQVDNKLILKISKNKNYQFATVSLK